MSKGCEVTIKPFVVLDQQWWVIPAGTAGVRPLAVRDQQWWVIAAG